MEVYMGKIIGSLVVRHPIKKKGLSGWRARCRACLSVVIVPSDMLLAGDCPNCRRGRA